MFQKKSYEEDFAQLKEQHRRILEENERLKGAIEGHAHRVRVADLEASAKVQEAEIKHKKALSDMQLAYEGKLAEMRHSFGTPEELTELRRNAAKGEALRLKLEASEELLGTYRQLPDLKNIYEKINDLKLPDTSAMLDQIGGLVNSIKRVESTDFLPQIAKLESAISLLTQRVEFLTTRVK